MDLVHVYHYATHYSTDTPWCGPAEVFMRKKIATTLLKISLCQIGVTFKNKVKKYLNYLSNLYSFNHGHIISAIQRNTHNGKL